MVRADLMVFKLLSRVARRIKEQPADGNATS